MLVAYPTLLFEWAICFWRALAASPCIEHVGEETIAEVRYQSFPRIQLIVVLFRSGYRAWTYSYYSATLAPIGGHTAVVISDEGDWQVYKCLVFAKIPHIIAYHIYFSRIICGHCYYFVSVHCRALIIALNQYLYLIFRVVFIANLFFISWTLVVFYLRTFTVRLYNFVSGVGLALWDG